MKTAKKQRKMKTSGTPNKEPPDGLARLQAVRRDAKSWEEIIEVMAAVMDGNAPVWLRLNIATELAAISYESMNPRPDVEDLKKRIHSRSPAVRLEAAREILDRALNKP
jgi:hypothetical protein